MEATKTTPIPNPENDAMMQEEVMPCDSFCRTGCTKGHYINICNHWLSTGLITKQRILNSNNPILNVKKITLYPLPTSCFCLVARLLHRLLV